jgi:hypothetical protein
MKGKFLLRKNGFGAGEPDEEPANIAGRAIMELDALTHRHPE